MLLAGDLGGTNCRFALFDSNLSIIEQQTYPCQNYTSFEAAVSDFVASHSSHTIEAACFGLPGPIINGTCKLTNLPWSLVEATKIEQVVGAKVTLLNDVKANAYGLETLRDEEIVTLKSGSPMPGGNRAVVAPGTGLGEAALIEVGGQLHAIASEGGHADFSPSDQVQWELSCYIQQEYKRASYELILSGPGLVRIYKTLIANGHGVTPPWLSQQMEQADAAAAISQAGLRGECQVCSKALDMFAAILASEAANAAVKFLARGGVYLGGGIPSRILDKLRQPLFIENFMAKDKIAHLLEQIPVYVILNQQTALQGSAWYGLRMVKDV